MFELAIIICICVVVVIVIISRSKCKKIKCCGIEIDRDVSLEERQHEFDVNNGVSEIPNLKNII